MIKNLKLLSIGLILNNSLFNTIVTKNKIFMVINLISLLLSGFSNNIFNYIYIYLHILLYHFKKPLFPSLLIGIDCLYLR